MASANEGNFDISVHSELFEVAEQVKQVFETDFEESLTIMQSLYQDMSEDDGFRGQACEGFMELFDILLQFHQDLVLKMPQVFTEIDNFSEALAEIKNTSLYTELY